MRTKRIWGLGFPTCVAALVVQLALPGPAHAVLNGSDYAYVTPGYEFAGWSHTNRTVGLVSAPTTGMSTSRCLDSMIDWQVTSGHYDARVVRSCQPGYAESTDPGGNGVWNEPSGWGGATVTDVQKGWGMRISDSYVNGNFARYADEPFAGTLGATYTNRPRGGCVDLFAKTRVRRQAGYSEDVCPNNDPRDANG